MGDFLAEVALIPDESRIAVLESVLGSGLSP
jgi:hypothetical protein